jgi:Toprim-like
MSALEWLVISQQELDDARTSSGWIRAYCHIHGGDHQRSLSINEVTGFGNCHRCGAQVLVREINPDAAANIERGQSSIADGTIKVMDPKYIARAARAPQQNVHSIEAWQKEEIDLLRALQERMTKHLDDERARTYIEGRGLSFETAKRLGVGYIPDVPLQGKYARIARWVDRIVFPVQSPTDGLQFVGRSLKRWEPGMDEDQHKEILEKANIKRWRKTHAGGWFNFQALSTATSVTFVEGAFDALALIEAGAPDAIAIIGTAVQETWLPAHLAHTMLAFDGDDSGIEKSERARNALYERGYAVTVCPAPQDGLGKDWSERYRLHGKEGLTVLLTPVGLSVIQVEASSLSPDDYCQVCGISVTDDDAQGNYRSCADDPGRAVYRCSKHWGFVMSEYLAEQKRKERDEQRSRQLSPRRRREVVGA